MLFDGNGDGTFGGNMLLAIIYAKCNYYCVLILINIIADREHCSTMQFRYFVSYINLYILCVPDNI